MKSLTYIVGESYREPFTGLMPKTAKPTDTTDVLVLEYRGRFNFADLRFKRQYDNTRVPPYQLTEIFDHYEQKGLDELMVEYEPSDLVTRARNSGAV